MEPTKLILEPLVQYGFLGFSAVLLGMVIWLTHKLVGLVEQNNKIVAANTDAIRDLTILTTDLLKLNRSLHDKLISRPCIARHEQGS